MKDVVGATSEEVRMIRAIQRAVGALDNGYIGNQTMSEIAVKVGAECWPLNVELYGRPCLIARDIEPLNPSAGLPENAVSGSFSWAGKPCSILVQHGKVVCGTSCHQMNGKPESVLYRTRDGGVHIARAVTAQELPHWPEIDWAVGGLGLLGLYAPAAEGFTGAYSDVLRRTNHTVLGYKGGMLYGVYCRSMTAAQVNTFCRDKLKLEKAVMLDGGHVAAIRGAVSRINVGQKQFYAVRFM